MQIWEMDKNDLKKMKAKKLEENTRQNKTEIKVDEEN